MRSRFLILFVETNQFMFANFGRGSYSISFIYDKKQKEYFAFYTGSRPDSGRVIGWFMPIAADGDNLFSVLDVSSVLSYKKMKKEGNLPENWELPEKLKGVQEEDNPIIIKYSIKTPILDSYSNDKVVH